MTKLVLVAIFKTAMSTQTETLRWARAGDSLTLDPHAQNEGSTSALARQIMESLVIRVISGKIEAALATDLGPSKMDPNVWEFNLRRGVKFHDGAEFDSEDVKFSLERLMTPNSECKELLASGVDARTSSKCKVEIVTRGGGANSIMVNNLTNLFIMDKGG